MGEHSTEKNEAVLTSLLETDDGARPLGELGIGMNRSIDHSSKNILFDEKRGDTIHLAYGQVIGECVLDEAEFNDSAVHFDMPVNMDEDSTIEVDGEVIQRDGTFVFADGIVA